jgi:hypothetical protein
VRRPSSRESGSGLAERPTRFQHFPAIAQCVANIERSFLNPLELPCGVVANASKWAILELVVMRGVSAQERDAASKLAR